MSLTPDRRIALLLFGVAAGTNVPTPLLLVYREEGDAGVRALLRRAFDWTRIPSPGWLVAIVLLPAAVYTLTYVAIVVPGASKLPVKA